MQSIQNLGLAVISIVAGKIVDERGYLALEVFFQICLCGESTCMRTHSDLTFRNVYLALD